MASMLIFAPNHSDKASANDGSTCLAVFQALDIQILVCVLLWHGVSDSLTEVLRWTYKWCFFPPISQCCLTFFGCLFCNLFLNLWHLLLPTGFHMPVLYLNPLRRLCSILYWFPKQVKCTLDTFLIEITICHESTFLSRTCDTCHCYMFNNFVNIWLVGILGGIVVPIPAAKFLIKEIVRF